MEPLRHKHWNIAPNLSAEADQELSHYPILSGRPILRRILYQRGYTTAEAAQTFIEAQPPPGSNHEHLLGMAQAVDRIRYAIQHHEQIAIYGDYDADGVTATALLTHALGHMGAEVRGYIPNRFDEGYGLKGERPKPKGAVFCIVLVLYLCLMSVVSCNCGHWKKVLRKRK